MTSTESRVEDRLVAAIEPLAASIKLFAAALVLTGTIVAAALLRMAAAHSDPARACLEGGGSEYQATVSKLDDQAVARGTCYHVER